MAIQHAESGEMIDIRPLESRLAKATTKTLVKSEQLEIIRMIVPGGKEILPHRVACPITVQCLEGCVDFQSYGTWQTLEQGQMLFLERDVLHALKGVQDSSILISIYLGNSIF